MPPILRQVSNDQRENIFNQIELAVGKLLCQKENLTFGFKEVKLNKIKITLTNVEKEERDFIITFDEDDANTK